MYTCAKIDDSKEGITLIAYSDTIKEQKHVTRENALKQYDEWADKFNNDSPLFKQEKGSVMAPVIYETIDQLTVTQNYTILIVMTDGDLGDVARDT